jgi:hypothetical protein
MKTGDRLRLHHVNGCLRGAANARKIVRVLLRRSARRSCGLTEEELNAIQQRVEADVARKGPPSDDELMNEIQKMNETAPGSEFVKRKEISEDK